jgi:N-acetylglutamate synthase-like GNAT family acetyltransferase
MPKPKSTLQLERTISATKRAVLKGLWAYNVEQTGRTDYKQIALSVRDGKGEIVGGLIAEIYWDWMFVRLLWIDEKHRGGNGAKLMAMAEEEARKRGARGVWLDTCSFQAPGFYKKLGFREFGRLDGHPGAHRRFWLAKML